MIRHSKGLDFKITDFEFDHDPTYTGATKSLKNLTSLKFTFRLFFLSISYNCILKHSFLIFLHSNNF